MTRQILATSTRHSRWLKTCGLALGLLLAASCSSAPLMAPTSSTLTLVVSRPAVGLSGSVTVTALVYESSGTPVHDGTVVAFFATLGTLSPAQATTTNGQATVQLVTGTQSGVSEITATSGGAKLASAVTVTVGAAAVGQVELTANPISLPSTGGTTILTAVVSDSTGNRLSGIPVTFTTDGGSLDQRGGNTDANGQVQSQLSTLVRTTVTASATGGMTGSVTSPAVIVTLRSKPNAAFGTFTVAARDVVMSYTAYAGSDGAAIGSVTINFGDGTSQGSLPAGSNQAITHRYLAGGKYTVTLTVTDVAGETAVATAVVTVV